VLINSERKREGMWQILRLRSLFKSDLSWMEHYLDIKQRGVKVEKYSEKRWSSHHVSQ
jgi:hypothetical protein